MNIYIYRTSIYIYISPLIEQVQALQTPDIDDIQERYKNVPTDLERGMFQGTRMEF